jgi:hypothetical protein
LELTDRHLVLLFHTTHETMHADSVLKAHRVRFKLIPRPRGIRDDCGLGVVIHREERVRVESLFPPEEIYAKAAFRIEKDGTWTREDYPPAPISYGSPPSGSTSP